MGVPGTALGAHCDNVPVREGHSFCFGQGVEQEENATSHL